MAHPPTDAAAERGQDAFEAFEALRILCDEIGALPDVGASMIPMRIDEVVAEARRLRTDAAAAERAEIVAMLRARATSEQICADRAQAEPDKTRMTYERIVAYTHSASVLREEADRIAARGPGPVWTEERVRKLVIAAMSDDAEEEVRRLHRECDEPTDFYARLRKLRGDIIARVRAGT